MSETPNSRSIFTRLAQIAELARRHSHEEHLRDFLDQRVKGGPYDLGGLRSAAAALSASSSSDRSLGVPFFSKSVSEEPDAVVPHVRVCGGPGRETSLVYPIPVFRDVTHFKYFWVVLRLDLTRS
jgi:hypothetical protein